jgi:hypothetical protein
MKRRALLSSLGLLGVVPLTGCMLRRGTIQIQVSNATGAPLNVVVVGRRINGGDEIRRKYQLEEHEFYEDPDELPAGQYEFTVSAGNRTQQYTFKMQGCTKQELDISVSPDYIYLSNNTC